METNINSYLEKNIPFALFRAPEKAVRFVAQLSELTIIDDAQKTGFHFAPFSKRENVPHLIIQNDVDIELSQLGKNVFPSIAHIEKLSPLNFNEPIIEKAVSFPTYEKDLHTYFDFFKNNNTQKAIYSRIKKVEKSEDFDLIDFFKKIENAYSNAFVYLVHLPGVGLWAGATPEILLKYKNGEAETVALAGTQRLFDNQNIQSLEWGRKEIEEHQMVADYIFKKINNNNLEIIEASDPYTSKAGAMAHLKQCFKFKINRNELTHFINDLHPTPAVCGLPKEKALDLIYATEPYHRQYYAGYLGMVEGNNDVDFYVNLRCMKIYNNTATLFVGGGITADSIPQKEWEETELKAKTLLNVLPVLVQ